MAKDLLLEIGLEEVPARFVRAAMDQLKEKMEKWLIDSRISYADVKAYATPRRLTVLVEQLADKQTDLSEEVKGPSRKIAYDENGAWSKPALGFARSQGVDPDSLFIREVANVEYVFATKNSLGVDTVSLLPEALPALITSLTFPKNMRWGSYELRYIRPIRWLVALYGKEIVPFEITDVPTSNVTRGHRFLGNDIVVEEPNVYVERLLTQHVIVDVDQRKQEILAGIKSLTEERGWHIAVNDDLLEEVLFLVETPTVLTGSFDPSFLEIPKDVLITSMREHQRYFPVFNSEDQLLPYFVTVRNGNQASLDVVSRGNEKVLRARLSDAKFFYEEDKKLVITEALAKLENVVYHEELGSVADKVRRVGTVAERISQHLRLEQSVIDDVIRTAAICKFDLVSQMVYEFPELQGIMGEDYARKLGEREQVAQAINEHYSPRNAGDRPATSLVGAIVGIADKLDTIVGCFSIGIIPTGSQDPYALRRQAAGIVSTLLAHEMEIPLPDLFQIALTIFAERGLKREAHEINKDMQEFFNLRLKNVLADQAVRYDVIDAVLGAGVKDAYRTVLKAQALQNAVVEDSNREFRSAIEAFNRVCNLAAKAESKRVDAQLFAEQAEVTLYEAWQQANGKFVQAYAQANMVAALAALSALSEPIAVFFEAVMVMAEDEALKRNRLAILALVADDVKQFADFTKLVG